MSASFVKRMPRLNETYYFIPAEVPGSVRVPMSRQTSADGGGGQSSLSSHSVKKMLASRGTMLEMGRPQLRKLAADIFLVRA